MKRATVTRPAVTALVAAGVLSWLCLSAGPPRLAAQGDKSTHVKVTATAEKPDADGKQLIAVVLEFEPGWHAFANPVGREGFEKEATRIKASVGGKPVEAKFDYPPGTAVKADDGNFRVYENKVTIKGILQRDKGDAQPLKLTVGFQPCSNKRCLQHTDIERDIP
jgi:hypothetical protein